MKRGLLALLALSWTTSALAAGPLGPEGSDIRTSDYAVDLTQTPVIAGSRVTGLAGAYVALAEGVDGNVQTPAAPAVRVPYSVDHFDYDFGFAFSSPAALSKADFFNSGHPRTQLSDAKQQGFVFVTPALNLMWGRFGLGATLEFQAYNLRRTNPDPTARTDQFMAQFVVGHFQAANLFAHGQLATGVGIRVLNLDVSNPNAPAAEQSLFNTLGAGLELGALVMPKDSPFRIGAAFRSAVTSVPNERSRLQQVGGDRVVGDPLDPANAFWLPNEVRMPWDINVGVAVQIGPRPLNPEWIDPRTKNLEEENELGARRRMRESRMEAEKRRLRAEGRLTKEAERALAAENDAQIAEDELARTALERANRENLKRRVKARPRRYLLVTSSLVVLGPVDNSVGVESFLQRVVARSGENVGLSPRLGVETELIPRWVTVRAGSYLEPTRFRTSSPRFHGTFGFDAKVLPWTVFGLFDDDTEWRVSGSIDGSERYLSWGVGIGIWH